MKRIAPLVLCLMALTTTAFAQAPAADFEVALLAAPAPLKDGATIIKWKPDYTYDTLKKGTNTLVCFDRAGLPGAQPVDSDLLDDDAFFASLRDAVRDDAPLGPVDDGFPESSAFFDDAQPEEPSRRFRRR